jgi:hypothetical protein
VRDDLPCGGYLLDLHVAAVSPPVRYSLGTALSLLALFMTIRRTLFIALSVVKAGDQARRGVDFAGSPSTITGCEACQLARSDNRQHRLVRGYGLRLSLEREGHEWPTVSANDVEALKEHAPFPVHCRVDFSRFRRIAIRYSTNSQPTSSPSLNWQLKPMSQMD